MKTRLDALELYRKEKIVWNDAQKMYGQNIFSLSPLSLHAIPKRKCFFNNFNLAFKPLMVSGPRRDMSPGYVSRVHVSRDKCSLEPGSYLMGFVLGLETPPPYIITWKLL